VTFQQGPRNSALHSEPGTRWCLNSPVAQSHRTQRHGDPERSQKQLSDKAARPDRCSSPKLHPRAKIVTPLCSSPSPRLAVLAVFCSEFNSGPKRRRGEAPIPNRRPSRPKRSGMRRAWDRGCCAHSRTGAPELPLATRLRTPRVRDEGVSGIKLLRFLASGFAKQGKQERTGASDRLAFTSCIRRASERSESRATPCHMDS
jgi:hypothetical protein